MLSLLLTPIHLASRRCGEWLGHAASYVFRLPATQRATNVVAMAVVVLVQGQPLLHAAELPQVATGVNARFEGALAPVVTGNNMVVTQTADKATLNWQSFNIGAGAQVEFKQPQSTSVALNRIFDAVPSQVNGALKANGQVYLINQNGIVFGGDAQVNTQSLVSCQSRASRFTSWKTTPSTSTRRRRSPRTFSKQGGSPRLSGGGTACPGWPRHCLTDPLPLGRRCLLRFLRSFFTGR